VPLNHVARVLGHQNISTTLDRYTHVGKDGDDRVRRTFADFRLTETGESDTESDQE
jgi:site-specific recombinase XerD